MEQLWQKLTALPFLARHVRCSSTGTEPQVSPEVPLLVAQDTADHLEQLTGFPCGHNPLYRTALTHRSLLHDQQRAGTEQDESNQRLEFLGDAVLDLVISEYLFMRFPTSAEGHLSSNRSKIVNRKSLAGFALNLKLGEHLIIGESADKTRIKASESALADTFEALVGAIYLDKGIAGAKAFIMTHVIGRVDLDRIVGEEYNYKSRLIEYTQSRQLPAPLYAIIASEGAEHEKTFTIEVSCMSIPLGKGSAPRKKGAEQIAAQQAMAFLEQHDPFEKPSAN